MSPRRAYVANSLQITLLQGASIDSPSRHPLQNTYEMSPRRVYVANSLQKTLRGASRRRPGELLLSPTRRAQFYHKLSGSRALLHQTLGRLVEIHDQVKGSE